MQTYIKRQRLTGAERERAGRELKAAYDSGKSIRTLVDETGRSYGFIHRILGEYDTQLRGRGGATRGKAAKAAKTSKKAT